MNHSLSNSPQVITFGCRLNAYESQVIKDLAQTAGMTSNTIIINTCAVTAEAERQARQSIRKLRRDNPNAEIIVTGCATQINASKYSAMPEVSRILGNEEKLKKDSYTNHNHPRVLVNDIMAVKETAAHLISGFEGKARAFVQIQNGCDHRCTFCTIPFGRGNSRSVPMGEITIQIRQLLEAGYQEIVFTGVDITAYGADLPGAPTLGQMIRRILALTPELKRLRLSSLDPVEIDEDLWRLIAEEPRLLPHLHLSLQAGDDMILKRMKRRHLRQDVIDFCKKARALRPDVVFGADLIAGFPTETTERFQNTLNIVEECELTFLHIFPYSSRPDTPASRMPQVSGSVIKERAAMLRLKGEQAVQKFLHNCIGKTTNVLIEAIKDQQIHGKTDQFAPIVLPFVSDFDVGLVISAKITGVSNEHLLGEVC